MSVSESHKKEYKKLRSLKTGRWILSAVGLVIIGIGLYYSIDLFIDFKQNETTNDAQIEQYLSPINVKVPGYIRNVYFTEHQSVQKGDTLLVIDDSEYRIRLKEAEAFLKDATVGSEVLDVSIHTSLSNVVVYDSNIAETEARLRKLETDYKRYQNLLERNATTPIQVEQIKTDLDATKARLSAQRQQQISAQSSFNEVSKRKGNSEANILRASAAVDMAKLNLSYTVIVAPCDGYLGRRTLEEGQLVNAGQNMTYIIPNTKKWIIANFKETQISNIHIGEEVEIKVDAFPEKVFKGKVSVISGATGSKYSLVPTDNSTGNFIKIQQRIPIRIDFEELSDEENKALAAGMMVKVKVKIKK
ncbi:HlyD family secretion protein [Bacteroides sp.]|uniref:HlyD family secretion protein n=1 Tax=Bacteroides sp. TaxID=29523 RepID=UPI001B41DEDA|nr:HlyD family secretion protein [Bacteroides sp.]MBP6936608.1 HlyD family secretion protein [Bacteroides sp.]MBP9585524.1 HlyD family secretion protein [Bacteroides sp.]